MSYGRRASEEAKSRALRAADLKFREAVQQVKASRPRLPPPGIRGKPVSKKGNITMRQAIAAVNRYLRGVNAS